MTEKQKIDRSTRERNRLLALKQDPLAFLVYSQQIRCRTCSGLMELTTLFSRPGTLTHTNTRTEIGHGLKSSPRTHHSLPVITLFLSSESKPATILGWRIHQERTPYTFYTAWSKTKSKSFSNLKFDWNKDWCNPQMEDICPVSLKGYASIVQPSL